MSRKFSKKIASIIAIGFSFFPQSAFGAIDGGVSTGGDGWSVGVGSGSGGFGLGNSFGLPEGSIFGIVENILYWLLAILGIVSVIGFVIAGLLYLTAAGDETQAGRAKKAMTYSIIGIIVGLAGFVVLQAAFFMLSGRIF